MISLKENILQPIVWHSARFVGRMPLRVQYAIADFIYIIIYKIVKYRVSVVKDNLKNSFPEKNDGELLEIEKKFYKHLADVFVETMALSYISGDDLKKRFLYDGIDRFQEIHSSRSVIAAMSHYGMWEMTVGYKLYTECPVKAVYHPLSSVVMEAFYKKMRSRFGTTPIPMNSTAREIVNEQKAGNNCVVALIADQTPPWHVIDRWFMFLNQPTAFFNGIEKLSLKYKMGVVFGHIEKVKRGYYVMHLEEIYDGEEVLEPHEITKRYVKHLEKVIQKAPEYWMWSHRRWKHKPKIDSIIME